MKAFFVAALLSLTALGFSQAVGDTYIIETTTPGVNLANYTANGMTVSTARVTAGLFPELTAARTQAAYNTLSVLNKTPKFTPTGLPAGRHAYKVEICWPNVASINATGVTYTVKRGNGEIVTGTFDELAAGANAWQTVGGTGATFDLDPAAGSYIQFSTATANGGVPDGAKRFYIDAMKLTLVTLNVPVSVSGFSVE